MHNHKEMDILLTDDDGNKEPKKYHKVLLKTEINLKRKGNHVCQRDGSNRINAIVSLRLWMHV